MSVVICCLCIKVTSRGGMGRGLRYHVFCRVLFLRSFFVCVFLSIKGTSEWDCLGMPNDIHLT